ncbi:MAG: hypothetical protein Kow0029_15810 [Candidatus Rifleibacteriota bacterium]
MKRNFSFFLLLILIGCLSLGCSEKTGILPDEVPEPVYVTPTISNLQVENTSISKCGGGILTIRCEWSSPNKVGTATAYLGFVKTIKNPTTEPVGVIGSQTATITASLLPQLSAELLAQTTTATDTCMASDTAAFFAKYADPIMIPTKIGTDQTYGRWEVDIPFAPEDTSIAPLGVYQMIFYMNINGMKTNTLAFELTFIP